MNEIRRLNYLLTYNQHKVSDVFKRFTDKQTGISTSCAVCAIAKAISDMKQLPYFPFNIIDLFDENDGFNLDRDNEYTLVKWNTIHKIWKSINIIPYIYQYDGVYADVSSIVTPSIISVDGNRIVDGYQSHFVYAHNLIYNDNKVVNIEIFDPWHDKNVLLIPHYGEDINKSIYSVINLTKC